MEAPAKVLPDGVFAASLTPVNEALQVDHGLLIEHVQWLLGNGCNGVALFGTTGEANSLSHAERMAGLEAVLQAGVPPGKLLVGVGCCAADETIALARHAVHHRVGGVLVLPPFYYKNPSDDGLFASYDQVIQKVGEEGLAVYLYHIPPVSQVPITHALIERLLKRYPETIVGMKDSGGDFEHTRSIRQAFPQLHLFAGTERFLLQTLRIDGAGCISACANVSCALAGQVYKAWESASMEVESLQHKLTAVRQALEPFAMIAALKFLNAQRTENQAWQRTCPPLLALSEAQGRQTLSVLQQHLSFQ